MDSHSFLLSPPLPFPLLPSPSLLSSPLLSPPSPLLLPGTVPVIRCPRGNAAEMVAQALDKKLRDNLRDSRNNVFSGENMTFSQLRQVAYCSTVLSDRFQQLCKSASAQCCLLLSVVCSMHRPLLVILDRGIDLATPMHHTWTYQALAHDILVRGGKHVVTTHF